MMTYTDMEQLLQFNDYESKIFMPNEIFGDLQKNIDNASHIAFAYSYIYFITWLYRYAKYGMVNELIDQKFIKKVLGYNENYKKLDYLIKQNGILEQMGYIRTEKDFPLAYSYDEIDGLQFQYIDDFKEYTEYIKALNIPKNFKIKFPVKAFYRDKDSEEDYYEDGTFFYVDRTHLVPFEAFIFCMTNGDLGCTGFYLYAFLRSKAQIFDGYDASIEKLIEHTGIPERTLYRYLDALKKHNMIQCYFDKEFIAGLPKEERRANTYYVNEEHLFSDTVRPYKKRGFKTLKQYEWDKLLEEEMQEQVQHQMEFLPQKNEN
ncbi:hypothetical protein HPJ93_10840 [Anoxybacillus flavithermus]|uniref:hypothetical protein n=1 Tax=Anoxybacillus flavithermus TaxID=33934 RepID=UPI001865B00E|nr:hypothetical protein [Anoxybacillus flavithermus]MBE2905532.1 hypothetical protein [Anoxybacillus flavithermus]MBE2922281.1 hypothetical protein [Anoxybacillus flavithermus]